MMSPECWDSKRKPHKNSKVLDYAIIGGGIGGAYCAWRLKSKHKKRKAIVLFEFSDRIGGRLLTVHLPGQELKLELGGMRYMPSKKEHPIFASLVHKLGLHTEPFPMGYTGKKVGENDNDPEGKNNYAYLRGHHLRISDLKDSSKVPFFLDWSEKEKTPEQLQYYVMKMLVPGAEDPKFKWFEAQVFRQSLWKFGFWNLLFRVLSPEAYLLFKYAGGYDTNACNGNAVALLPVAGETSSGNEYSTVEEGMMAVPCELCREFVDIAGGQVELNRRLVSIQKNKDKSYSLRFSITKTEQGKRESTGDTSKFEEWKTYNVILALPRAALEKIEWKDFKDDDITTLKQNLESVLIQPAVKIGLEYDYPWWKAFGIFRGRSISDLPLRQTYYFTDLQELKQKNPFEIGKDKHAVMIASYSDIESVPFWHGLEPVPSESEDGANSTSCCADLFDGSEHGYRASKLMVREAHKQVMTIHGQYELPEPHAAAYYDWGESPSGGAWHFWKAGYRYDRIIDKMRKPLQDENIFTCGEAYSSKQGWAEGALQTAEEVLCKYIKTSDRLKKLDWVKTISEVKTVVPRMRSFEGHYTESLKSEREELAKLTDDEATRWIRSDSKHRVF